MKSVQEPKFFEPDISPLEEMSARLVELNIELDRKNRLLQASEQARARILDNISHDLRAPLTVVRGALDRILNSTVSADESSHLIDIIDRRMTVLERLVDELYLSQKMDQPEFKLKMTALPVAPFLQEYFIMAETAGIFDDRDALLNIESGFDGYADLDAEHFLRILDNLFSNALRHTSPGDRIELGCRSQDDYIRIHVFDSGEGISETDLPHIFERTYSVSSARTPQRSGSGLGLYLAQLIAEKHGGSISCESTLGKGSTFNILLPKIK